MAMIEEIRDALFARQDDTAFGRMQAANAIDVGVYQLALNLKRLFDDRETMDAEAIGAAAVGMIAHLAALGPALDLIVAHADREEAMPTRALRRAA